MKIIQGTGIVKTTLLFAACLCLMITADFLLGEKAEYLNAWNIIQIISDLNAKSDLKFIVNQEELGPFALTAGITAVISVNLIASLLFAKIFTKTNRGKNETD
jgi:hypothetical protein